MKPLKVNPTEYSPRVLFDPDKNIFEIEGYSRPENVSGFFVPVMEYIKEYEKKIIDDVTFRPGSELIVRFMLKYFNSASSKFILDIINSIHDLEDKGLSVKVEWYYEEGDETILESGEDLSDIADIPFHYIEFDEDK